MNTKSKHRTKKQALDSEHIPQPFDRGGSNELAIPEELDPWTIGEFLDFLPSPRPWTSEID